MARYDDDRHRKNAYTRDAEFRFDDLDDLNDYELVDESQDIRGWPVEDTPGHVIGEVDKLCVNTRTELVEEVLLDDGRRIPASDITIGDDTVYLHDDIAMDTVRVYDDCRIRRKV